MLKTQNSDGMWDAFKAQKKTDYYSSMIQSQGVSLLLRAYKLTNNNAYLFSAQKAFDVMLKPVAEGGTAFFKNGHICMYFSRYGTIEVKPDDYCSKAERREE